MRSLAGGSTAQFLHMAFVFYLYALLSKREQATGAGKTHTMMGYAGEPGVMVLTMDELFKRIEAYKLERTIEITVSMLEVYNETIRDVLVTPGTASAAIEVREDANGQIVMNGLSEHRPKSSEDVLQLLAIGNRCGSFILHFSLTFDFIATVR